MGSQCTWYLSLFLIFSGTGVSLIPFHESIRPSFCGTHLSPSPADLYLGPIVTIQSLSTSQAWERLEKAEHERELALRTELIRQEKLEQLAARFDRKAAMRETWLSENQRLVSQVGLMSRAHPGWWGEM